MYLEKVVMILHFIGFPLIHVRFQNWPDSNDNGTFCCGFRNCYHSVYLIPVMCMMCNKVQFTNRLSTVVNVLKAYLQRKKKLMSSYKGYKEETVYENRTMN